MKKIAIVATMALLVTLTALPAMAELRIISDKFNKETGIGTALVRMSDNVYAYIAYKDTDNSQSFTVGDERLKVSTFRKATRNDGGIANVGRNDGPVELR